MKPFSEISPNGNFMIDCEPEQEREIISDDYDAYEDEDYGKRED